MGDHAAEARGREEGVIPVGTVPNPPFEPAMVEAGQHLFTRPCDFRLGAAAIDQVPALTVPEVAFAGRSNVGKSSAINALLGRRALARTSKTPGRTQTINLYSLGQEGKMQARLADLPGYGYAKVPQAQRAQWRQLVGDYLETRPTLAGVVVIMDARHPYMPLDRQLLQWLGDLRKLVLLSKADKLSRAEQAALQKVHGEALLFSSSTRQGVEECRALLEGWIQQGAEIKSPR